MSDSREITLTRGQVAIVDVADYEWLNQWKWRAQWNRGLSGFYAIRSIRRNGTRESILMHRLILGLRKDDKRHGDHKEPSQTLDNRRSNLRIATCSQNFSNSRLRRDTSSGLKGVSFMKSSGRWRAYVMAGGAFKHLGCFSTPELAHEAYCKAATEHYGEFARFA